MRHLWNATRWRWTLAVAGAALVTSQIACAPDRTDAEPPATRDAPRAAPETRVSADRSAAEPTTQSATPPARGKDPSPEAAAARTVPAPAIKRGPNDLSGPWTLFMRSNEWTVTLEPAIGLPNEYAGMARRDTPDARGTDVELKLGAVLTRGRLKAWLGPGIVVCEAPFSRTSAMTGTCRVAIGEGEPGPFRAARLP
jgi:hypothetical protein